MLFDADTGEITSTCTGSLVGDRYVLTAAHCLVDVTAAAVALDFEDLADLETAEVNHRRCGGRPAGVHVRPTAQRHRAAAVGGHHHRAQVAIAGVDDDATTGGALADIVGWGATDGQGTPTEQLLEGDVQILATDACYAQLAGLYQHADQICGSGLVNDTCFGDSGGPLLVDDGGPLLVGVTSSGVAPSRGSSSPPASRRDRGTVPSRTSVRRRACSSSRPSGMGARSTRRPRSPRQDEAGTTPRPASSTFGRKSLD